MKKIAVFASGSGSDFQSIIDACLNREINGEIVMLISSSDKAFALERAKNNNIESAVFMSKNYPSIEIMYDEVITLLKSKGVELIVLAGYLKILTPNIIKAFENSIINIHPSLIPSFCGMGYYGLKVHQAVIDYGVKVTGATVHFVNENADEGAIILQKTVEVEFEDTAESVQKKVLEEEHKLLPQAVKLFCDDKLKLSGRRVEILK